MNANKEVSGLLKDIVVPIAIAVSTIIVGITGLVYYITDRSESRLMSSMNAMKDDFKREFDEVKLGISNIKTKLDDFQRRVTENKTRIDIIATRLDLPGTVDFEP